MRQIFFILVFIPALILGTELQYTAARPVAQTHHVSGSVTLDKNGNQFDFKIDQHLELELVILGEPGAAVKAPPFDVQVKIKEYASDLEMNGGLKRSYSTSMNSDSPWITMLKRMIDRPLILHVEKDGTIHKPCQELLELTRVIPPLEKILPQGLFRELVQHSTVLGGRTLDVGSSVSVEFPLGVFTSRQVGVDYSVKSAGLKGVTAGFKGVAPRFEAALASFGLPDASVQIKGDVEGEGTWRRGQGLMCDLSMTQRFDGKGMIKEEPIEFQGVWQCTIQSKSL